MLALTSALPIKYSQQRFHVPLKAQHFFSEPKSISVLFQILNIADCQTNDQIHHDDAHFKDEENEQHQDTRVVDYPGIIYD